MGVTTGGVIEWLHHSAKGAIMSQDYMDRITIEPNKRSGQPCIRGMRITVYDIVEYMAGGMSEDEILYDFPELEREDVRASLAFVSAPERRLRQEPPPPVL